MAALAAERARTHGTTMRGNLECRNGGRDFVRRDGNEIGLNPFRNDWKRTLNLLVHTGRLDSTEYLREARTSTVEFPDMPKSSDIRV